MQDVVQFCKKTIAAAAGKGSLYWKATQTKNNLSINKKYEAAAKKVLQQRKFKKFSNLKYKPKATTQPMTQQEIEVQEKTKNPRYPDVLKRKESSTNFKRK